MVRVELYWGNKFDGAVGSVGSTPGSPETEWEGGSTLTLIYNINIKAGNLDPNPREPPVAEGDPSSGLDQPPNF